MADNVSTTGGVFATDDIGGAHYERIKLVLGADGVNDGDVHSSNPLPVDLKSISSVATQATLANVSTFTNSTNTLLARALASSTALWVQTVPGTAQATVSTTVVIRTVVYDTSDNQITSFSNTQYVEGNTSTLPTGIVMLWKSAVSTLRAASTSDPFPVTIQGTTTTQPVSGTVTANVGTVSSDTASTVALLSTAVANLLTSSFGIGVTTVPTAGTDIPMSGAQVAKWVTIQAQTDNTNYIAVGVSTVDATIATGNGILLAPGDTLALPCVNLSSLYLDALVSGEGVRYIYGN